MTKFYKYENNFGEVFKKETRGLKIIFNHIKDQFLQRNAKRFINNLSK